MNTLYSYLKAIEQKLSAPEIPEVQFLNIDIYKSSSFNLKSLSFSIFEKIKDTSYLLNQLKLTIEKTKNEIFEQINSNYTNYVALISKLQTIDFLVDNIQQSFVGIKNKIDNKMNLIKKYEKELTDMLTYINENDKEIIKIQKSIKEYSINIKISKYKNKIEQFMIKYQNDIKEYQYNQIRQLLFLFISYFELVKEDENKYFNFFNLIEDILYHYIENYFIKQNNTDINIKLDLNIIKLIHQIYKYTNKEDILYQKLFNGFIKSNFNKITDINKDIPNIIEELINYMNSNLINNLSQIFAKNNFHKICFLNPFITKFIKEKFLFNCSDVNKFIHNYISIIKFFKCFNLSEEDINTIRNFLQNFSFYTYYQYIQNDISNKMIGLISYKDNNIDKEYINMINNVINDFIGIIRDNSNKIFVKILPNYLTFISQCIILLYTKTENALKICKNNNINKELENELNNNFNNLKNYFKYEGEFCQNILNNVYENEKFLINDEKNEFKNLLHELLSSIDNMKL